MCTCGVNKKILQKNASQKNVFLDFERSIFFLQKRSPFYLLYKYVVLYYFRY